MTLFCRSCGCFVVSVLATCRNCGTDHNDGLGRASESPRKLRRPSARTIPRRPYRR